MLIKGSGVIVIAAAVALLLGGAGRADNAALVAEVGPPDGHDFYITLKNTDGAAVTHLEKGTYTIQVKDVSPFHNFHLAGAPYTGVDKRTQIDFVGEQTWTVTLTDGEYWFVCDPHHALMRGDFTVGVGHYVAPKPKPKPKPKKKKAPPKKK